MDPVRPALTPFFLLHSHCIMRLLLYAILSCAMNALSGPLKPRTSPDGLVIAVCTCNSNQKLYSTVHFLEASTREYVTSETRPGFYWSARGTAAIIPCNAPSFGYLSILTFQKGAPVNSTPHGHHQWQHIPDGALDGSEQLPPHSFRVMCHLWIFIYSHFLEGCAREQYATWSSPMAAHS